MTEVVVVLVTGPDRAGMIAIGRALVEERLVACANVLDDVTSVFRWEGAVTEEAEALVILKTSVERLPELRDRVLELHPYDEPEFLALRVEAGSPGYLEWVAGSVDEA